MPISLLIRNEQAQASESNTKKGEETKSESSASAFFVFFVGFVFNFLAFRFFLADLAAFIGMHGISLWEWWMALRLSTLR